MAARLPHSKGGGVNPPLQKNGRRLREPGGGPRRGMGFERQWRVTSGEKSEGKA